MRVVHAVFLLLALAFSAGAATAAPWHYVDGLDPNGDNFLALRSAPDGAGKRLARMAPGTLLEVLGRRGAWLEVRTADGRSGWAHGDWVYCCREVAAAAPAQRTPAAKTQAPAAGTRATAPATRAPAPRAVAPAATAQVESCDALWHRRNAIFHRYGYCFGSARGQQAFGNAGCSRNQSQAQAAMSPADRDEVGRLIAREAARGCR